MKMLNYKYVILLNIMDNNLIVTQENKIDETVSIGSVFLALDNNYFTDKELLNWLSTTPITILTKIAYKALCTKIHPNDQYLNSGYHLLVKKPEYCRLSIHYGLDLEIPDKLNSEDDTPIIIYICHLASIDKNSNDMKEDIYILRGSRVESDDHLLSYKAREFNHCPDLTVETININLADADWIEKFRYNEILVKIVMKRLDYLKKNHINYYNFVYDLYRKIVEKLNKDKLLTNLTKEELIELDNLYPSIIDKRILEYNGLEYKLAILGDDIAGYVLGFPVHFMIPNEAHIHEAIAYIKQQGTEEYNKYICNYNAQSSTLNIPFKNNNVTKYANETDVLMEDINNYVSFDVVSYRCGDHVYRFSRPEFDQILKSKKNPWTNEWLPISIVETIKSRVKTAKELALPPSRPLLDMLKNLELGKLFEATKKEMKENHSNIGNVHAMGFLLALLGGGINFEDE
jgi:hypothetical protein